MCSPVDWRGSERTAFIEALSHHAAVKEDRGGRAVLPGRPDLQLLQLIAEGLSEVAELRIFETGWSGYEINFVDEPLFLLEHPAALIRLWASIPQGAQS